MQASVQFIDEDRKPAVAAEGFKQRAYHGEPGPSAQRLALEVQRDLALPRPVSELDLVCSTRDDLNASNAHVCHSQQPGDPLTELRIPEHAVLRVVLSLSAVRPFRADQP